MGRRLALLIATYAYEDTGLRRLTAPAHDAEALAAVLADPEIAGFDVTVLVNEPHYRVGEAIADFYRDRRRDDLTLLYFTGHGLKDDEGRLYLAMADTRRDSLMFTALSAEQIDQAVEGCVSGRKVLILDCCYSGAFPAGRLTKADPAVHTLERFQGSGRTVLTASDATQYSFEGDRARADGEPVRSVFTHYLVQGLRDGSADLDGDGDITLDELYDYVHDRVVEEVPQQRPKKKDDVVGRTVIARNVNWALPGHLRGALDSPIAADRLRALDGLARLHRIGNEFVRESVLGDVRRLADDDSKLVSAAATGLLRGLSGEREEGEQGQRQEQEQEQEREREREREREERQESPDSAPDPSPGPAPEQDPDPSPGPALDPSPDPAPEPDLAPEPGPVPPGIPRRRARLLAAVVALLVLAAAVVVVLVTTRDKGDTTDGGPDGGSASGKGAAVVGLSLRRTLPDAGTWVNFTADGKALVAATGQTTRLLDPATGKTTAKRTEGYPELAAPDGRTLVLVEVDSKAADISVKLLDVATGATRVLPAHPKGRVAMAFSPDGRTLATASTAALGETYANPVRLWDVATGRNVADLTGHTNGVQDMAFSPDGRTLATGVVGDRGGVWLWDVGDREHTATLASGLLLAFSPDGGRLAASGWDKEPAELWDLGTRKPLATFDRGEPLAFAPDGRTLAVAGVSGALELWSVAAGAPTTLDAAIPGMDLVEFGPDGTTAALVDRQGPARLRNLADGRTVDIPAEGIQSVSFSPDGRTLATAGKDRTVRLWELRTGQ
ncbi:caspase family protein [Streptomyces sp. NPDC020422]|uniref:caspase, EACC1-associated type n=1 Tax=Streptomyces sp. NPDC020422 TaxID=3365074 RepID=UPI0037B0FCE0